MFIEPARTDPFETKIDSTEIDAEHCDLVRRGYRHYANVTGDRASIEEATMVAKHTGYNDLAVHEHAYDDKGVLIHGAISIWVRRHNVRP